jgi:hypothetical protein
MSTSSNSTSRWTRKNNATLTIALAIFFSYHARALAQSAPVPVSSPSPVPAAVSTDAGDPCDQLSNLVSRPSFSTAACVVKPNALLLQTGYANLATSGANGSRMVTYPQENVSIGVAKRIEFDINPPSFARIAGSSPASGATDGSIGAKVQLGQSSRITSGVNALYTLQSGTAPFTGSGDGVLVNVNASYALSPAAGLFASLGYNEQSAGTPEVPAAYHDVQPSLGASFALPQNFTIYAEGFNQSSTGPGMSGSFAFDTGLQKDIGSRLQVDAEIFDYPSIRAGAHQHAVGFGAAYLFGP